MEKKLLVDKNLLIVSNLLYMLDYFVFEEDVHNQIIKLREYIENKIYGDFFENTNDILDEIVSIKYIFEENKLING